LPLKRREFITLLASAAAASPAELPVMQVETFHFSEI
jgi:hypothetical protein